MKKNRLPILLVLLCIFLTSCSSGVPQKDYDALEAEYSSLQEEYDALRSQYDDIQSQYTDLQASYEQAEQEIETLTAAAAEAEARLAEEQQARQAAEQAQQDAELAAQQAAKTTTASSSSTASSGSGSSASQSAMVWVSKTGSKYHSSSSCSNMKNPSQISGTGTDPLQKVLLTMTKSAHVDGFGRLKKIPSRPEPEGALDNDSWGGYTDDRKRHRAALPADGQPLLCWCHRSNRRAGELGAVTSFL